MSEPAGRLAASVALASAALLGVLTGCGGGSPDRGATLGTVLGTTTIAPAPNSEAASVAPGQVATTSPPPAATLPGAPADGGGNGGGGRGGGEEPGAPPNATAPAAGLAPAPPGTYRYDTAGSSTFALTTVPYPDVSTLVVDAPVGTRQHSRRDLRDAEGTGPVLDLFLDYRPDGIYVEALRLGVGYGSIPPNGQELRPPSPQLLVPTDAPPGTHLEYDLPTSGSTAHLVIDIGAHEPVDVGGQTVDTVAMRVVATLPSGPVSGRVEIDARLAPSVSLWVSERFSLDAAGGGLTLQSQYEATLQSLP